MFIGSNLENVRSLNGLSRKELSEKIAVSEQAIWQYEVKNMMPEINKIYDISKLFNVTTAYFINEQRNEFKEVSVDKHSIAFRAKNYKVSTKMLNKQHSQANYLSNLTSYLFSFVKMPVISIMDLIDELDTFIMDSEETSRDLIIKQCANISRNKLLSDKSNDQLLFQLEKSGIIVYEKHINSDADAFSFWSDTELPFIILGSNKGNAVRRVFDLAHELCHLLLHRYIQFDVLSADEYKAIEREANLFAAEFLLPEEEFVDDFNNLTKKSNPDQMMLLKEKWVVSIQAMGMRAYYLGLITDVQYRYFWASINKKGYKKKEPLDESIQISKPVKINSLLDYFFRENLLSPEQLLNDLKVEPQFLSDIACIDNRILFKYMNTSKTKQHELITNLFR
ncbi:XRE family transcriptional regulator [Mammaliicoccus sp. Dog046]|uniref:spr1629 family repressor/antitoxin n=1 Tax=Mammaliicoccus sp. Dog046 TaxID=3034233 RepID=UPI002B25E588|nr:XRE family transcriptional regulator [Mammaliicoccus sp. Dog046]WQK85656.1 XRE family transcriptional regulator [Mammaliicoccus sp. Dog046]